MIREKARETRTEEVIAQTRQVDSPYFQINPSGRVPYLVRDDGDCMEASQLICDYPDQIGQVPKLDGRKEKTAGSICVWKR